MSFGSRLKERREQIGMTQIQLAKQLGITKGAVENYETGVSSPKAEILFKIFKILHCDANYLFQDDLERLNTDLENADNQIFDGNHTMKLGEIINFYRKQNEMTIDQLSEKSNVAKGTLNKIINGVTEDPQFETVKSIAKALGCTLDDLDDSMSYKNHLITQGKEDESIGIGNRIKQARECLGYTQKELAEKVGVTSSAIANYENEISHPKKNIMCALMETLKIDANFLFQDCIKTASPLDTATPTEMEYLIKKYRCLDEHGKEIVDIILSIEYNRCIGLSE